ncbi:MAG: esterase family protein [Planctomycetaceae bacterium]|nr:MAG: esterase family protein [Planctomycetaceae bacterium]
MAFCSVNFFADSLGKAMGMNAIVPTSGKGPFPVLYLLHGLSDDYTLWQRRSSIERYAERLPVIVVMPDGGRSFYCNDPRPGGMAFEDHIVKDVVGTVDRLFPTIASRGGRAIAGLSMGGYGALMLSLRHPDMFSIACSHSGAMGIASSTPKQEPGLKKLTAGLPKESYDLYRLAKRFKLTVKKMAIRIDCGAQDFLIEDNRQFHAHLTKLGMPHEYQEYPGGHSWEYWDEHVQQTLKFAMEYFKKK